jgi:hypothetical protein
VYWPVVNFDPAGNTAQQYNVSNYHVSSPKARCARSAMWQLMRAICRTHSVLDQWLQQQRRKCCLAPLSVLPLSNPLLFLPDRTTLRQQTLLSCAGCKCAHLSFLPLFQSNQPSVCFIHFSSSRPGKSSRAWAPRDSCAHTNKKHHISQTNHAVHYDIFRPGSTQHSDQPQ